MTLSSHNKKHVKKRRPWLTATCERLLRCTLSSNTETASDPLPTIPRRLLVVKVFGMGDSILVRSLVDKLHESHRDMQIGVLVGPATREIMTNRASFQVHQYVPRTLSISSTLKMLKDIRSCHYEAILNCEQRSLAGSAFLALTGAPYHIGFIPISATPKGRFLTHALRFRDDLSVWQSFICLARLIDSGIPQMFLPTAPAVSEEDEKWARGWWSEHVGSECAPTVALHMGSQDREFSRWPVCRFVELAERVRSRNRDLSIMLTGTPPEGELISAFIRAYSGRAIDASESSSLFRTAALLKRCGLLVSNDTGIMHLGAALGVPTVGLFGPNSPRYWAPLGPRATFVYNTEVACSPCLNLYADRWPLECSHPEKGRCMLDIKVDSVMIAARRVIVGEWLN
jgi:lipopolysaccharide heptosyltransferase II